MTTPMQPDPMGGMIAGSSDLQSTMDRLDLDIRGLTAAINGMNNGNGTNTSPAMSSTLAAQGVTFTGGGYAGAGGGSGGGILGGFGAGGNNGSGGTGGTNPYSMFGGGSLLQGAVNVASSVVNGQFRSGAMQLGDQALINTYGYTQAGFWNVSSGSAIGTAFGGGAGGRMYMNNLATSASDARIGGMLLSQISGQANYTAGAGPTYGRGNAPFQLAATTGMANPGLGMANAAGISGAWYNPSTSYNLMMMGVANTPLQLGTGRAQNMAGVEAAIGQRFGFQGFNAKTGTFNAQNLAANLNNPMFQMQIMDATGMSQQQYNIWAQQWAQMNNWAVSGKTTMNAMQNEVSQYMNGSSSQQKQAQAWLGQHGVSQSLLQSMTQAQAGQTAAEAGGNVAFTKGLQAATGWINKFTEALAKGYQAMAATSGGAAAIGSLNTSGVIGAGSGGVSNTALNFIAGNMGTLAHDLLNFQATLNTLSFNTGGGGSSGGPGGGSAKQNQALGQKMAAAYGWGRGSQWNALNTLMMHESGWITDNQNPHSSAFGIGQFLDTTWGIYDGITKAQARGNPTLQIKAMLDYVKGRWGSPANAMKNYWNQFGPGIAGYADGTTSAKPGVAVVGERGPEIISLSGGQGIVSAAQTAKMLQPVFSGAGGAKGSGGMSIVFQSGAITISSSGGGVTAGHHTSADVQSIAAQLIQAVEIGLNKNILLKNIAAGVTG